MSARLPIAVAVAVALAVVALVVLVARRPSGAHSVVAPEAASEAEPASDARDPADSSAAAPTAREAARPGESAPRSVALVLVRHPDEVPLAYVQLETVPPASVPADGELRTAEDGRIELELPAGTAVLEVRAHDHEPARVALAPGASEARVALVPSSGLFGRVVLAEGRPAGGATLALAVEERFLSYASRATRSRPRASVSAGPRTVARATANDQGWYYVSCATRTTSGAVDLRASTDDGRVATRRVELPREPVALEDLVVDEPDRLRVRVVDLAGAPIAGVGFSGNRASYPGTTDARGELALAVPELPVLVYPRAAGYWLRERRHDGEIVLLDRAVESSATRLELVLAPIPGARLRIVDAATGARICSGQGRVELVRAGEHVGDTSFEVLGNADAHVTFVPQEDFVRGVDAPPADLARIRFQREGYQVGLLEVDPRVVSSAEPLVMSLQPEPASACLRGRVVRAGAPVPGFRVTLQARRRVGPPEPRALHAATGWTDEEGRFALRWPDEPGLAVIVFPHWVQFEEFGFIGPLDSRRAVEEEHELELLPAVRVPAILRGVEAEASYCYYVDVLDDEGVFAMGTTINGAPIALGGAGERHTTITLPAHRRVRVTIGIRTGATLVRDGSPPVEHDPARPALPLVFEVRPLYARVTGRVAGFAPGELALVGVGFEREHEESARLVRPASDGTFAIERIPRGKGVLYLVREAEPGARYPTPDVLARRELELDRDVEGVVFGPDPESLPEEPPR